MTNNKVTVTCFDPESKESNEIEFDREINGWMYDDETNDAAIVWRSTRNKNIYVGWEKTGGHTWSAWLDTPNKIPRNTIYKSESSPDNALQEAKMIMKRYKPEEAENKFCE